MIKKHFFLLVFLMLCNPVFVLAQGDPESVVSETDKFEDYFFEAIKQKAIENYDLALVQLEQCLKLKPNDLTVYSELGKNYFGLKNYEQSYSSFEKASQIDPKNKWIWQAMYDVNYQTKNYDQAIVNVNKLIEFDPVYKEDLVPLYMYTKQFEKAMALINELNETVGKSQKLENYKQQILSKADFQNPEIDNLLGQIKLNPKIEANYIALIKLYTELNDSQKAVAITKKLETEIPNSDWVQIGLFKFYLDKKDVPKAVVSMNKVLENNQVDSKIKHRILNEFLIFVVKNPQYSTDLDQAIRYFDKDPDVNVAKEIGKFYFNKKQWEKAIIYYESALKNNSETDIETQILLLQTYIEIGQFEEVTKKAGTLVELYPSQPQFYFYSGWANNQLKQHKKAIDMLEMGIDFVLEDKNLEIKFNLQLSQAYNALGDFAKKEKYFTRANQLSKLKN